MTEQNETVVRVDTLKEYRAVLEKWFSKGYSWYDGGDQEPHDRYLTHNGARYLILEGNVVSYSDGSYVENRKLEVMSFKELMDKEHGKVTYEVSEDQMALIEGAKDDQYPASYLMGHNYVYEALFSAGDYDPEFERDLLRYLGGDANVAFQLKEPLYRLKGNESDGETVYFKLNVKESPSYTYDKSAAFVAPQEEITRWKSPFWEIEEVKEGN